MMLSKGKEKKEIHFVVLVMINLNHKSIMKKMGQPNEDNNRRVQSPTNGKQINNTTMNLGPVSVPTKNILG